MAITIKGIEKVNAFSATWGNYDFDKDSLAVVVLGEFDKMCVLWTAGPHVRMEIEEAGVFADEVLPAPDEEGVWVWEGRGIWYPGSYECPDDGSIELEGKYRKPTDEEWQAIREGCCPWNDEEWKLKEGAEG